MTNIRNAKSHIRNAKSRWCVTYANSAKPELGIGPHVWSWHRWRWQAALMRHRLLGAGWKIMSSSQLDAAWARADDAWRQQHPPTRTYQSRTAEEIRRRLK